LIDIPKSLGVKNRSSFLTDAAYNSKLHRFFIHILT